MHLKQTPNDRLDVAGTIYRVKPVLSDRIKLIRGSDAVEYDVEWGLRQQLLYTGFLKFARYNRADDVGPAVGHE